MTARSQIESAIVEHLYAHPKGCTRLEFERLHAAAIYGGRPITAGSWGGPVSRVWSQLRDGGHIVPTGERRGRAEVYVLAQGMRELMAETEVVKPKGKVHRLEQRWLRGEPYTACGLRVENGKRKLALSDDRDEVTCGACNGNARWG